MRRRQARTATDGSAWTVTSGPRKGARWMRRAAGAALVAALVLGAWAVPPAAAESNAEVDARFYERAGDGVVERIVPPPAGPGAPAPALLAVTEEAIAVRLDRAGQARATALSDPAHAAGAPRLVPEDPSRRARVLHVMVSEFTDAGFARMLADVGALEGFTVVAHTEAGGPWGAGLAGVANLLVSDTPGRQYTWPEDVSESGGDGSLSVTARRGDRRWLRRSLFVDRVRRFYPAVTPAELEALRALPEPPDAPPGEIDEAVMRRYSDIMFMNLGLVEKDLAQDVAA